MGQIQSVQSNRRLKNPPKNQTEISKNMSNIRKRLLPSPTGLAANNIAVFDLRSALNKDLYYVQFEISDSVGTDLLSGAYIGKIEVIVNEGVQRRMTAVELNNENARRGVQYATHTAGVGAAKKTYLTIYFYEPWLNDTDAASRLAWKLQGAGSCRIEIEIKNVVSPNITGFYGWLPSTGTWGGLITKWKRTSFQASGSENDFVLDAGDFYHSINLYPPSGGSYVNKVRIEEDGEIKHDLIPTLANQAALLGLGLNPDTSDVPEYAIVLDAEDPINGAVPTQGRGDLSMHVEYAAGTSGNMIAIIQRTGFPEAKAQL
jgi:hypothetical protein